MTMTTMAFGNEFNDEFDGNNNKNTNKMIMALAYNVSYWLK